MSSFSKRRFGLRLSSLDRFTVSALIAAGPDVSWLSRCHVGDDQGRDGACAIFAFASWAEIVHGTPISDDDCLRVYRDTIASLGRDSGDGLTFLEACSAARAAGWLPGSSGLAPANGTLTDLFSQPLVAGYAVTPGWERTSSQGCLDHSVSGPELGYHAVVIAAYGSIGQSKSRVYIENSWGLSWGWNGIGVMTEELHRRLARELWVVT